MIFLSFRDTPRLANIKAGGQAIHPPLSCLQARRTRFSQWTLAIKEPDVGLVSCIRRYPGRCPLHRTRPRSLSRDWQGGGLL